MELVNDNFERAEKAVVAMTFATKVAMAHGILKAVLDELMPHSAPDNIAAQVICRRIENALGEIAAQQKLSTL